MTPIDFNARFGFRQPPFSREIAVEHRFSLPFFDEALLALRRTIDAKASAALIAPAGTGKTALLRALIAALPEARFRFHYVKVTGLSKRDMCREIANACGAEPAGSYPMLVRRLQERVASGPGFTSYPPWEARALGRCGSPHYHCPCRVTRAATQGSMMMSETSTPGSSGAPDAVLAPLEAVTRRVGHGSLAERLNALRSWLADDLGELERAIQATTDIGETLTEDTEYGELAVKAARYLLARPGKRDPVGALVIVILRRIAYSLLAFYRAVTLRSEERRYPPWKDLLTRIFVAMVAATTDVVSGLRLRLVAAAPTP